METRHISTIQLPKWRWNYDLEKDIAANGITKPVILRNSELVDGLWRVIISYKLGIVDIPIESVKC